MQCHLADKKPLTVPDLQALQMVRSIYESSHHSVWISRCGQCGQLYAVCFDEDVDWEQGNDKCWNFYVPIESCDIPPIEADTTQISALMQCRPFITWAPGDNIYWTTK
ncbi:MAG: hypothetical protein HZA50_08040 [Planctomycetes bacterium]|nr:hypothetical protein [Planctomycetota bacterium]